MPLSVSDNGAFLTSEALTKIVEATISASSLHISTVDALCSIELLSSSEMHNLSTQQVKPTSIDEALIFPIGIGGDPTRDFYYISIAWNAGQLMRRKFGLPPKPFRINLTGHDDAETCLLYTIPRDKLSSDALVHIAFGYLQLGRPQQAREMAEALCKREPESEKGWTMLGDIALQQKACKLAMLAFGRVLHLPIKEKVLAYVRRRMLECAEHTEWGHVFQKGELEQLPATLETTLLVPWTQDVRSQLQDIYGDERSPKLTLDSHIPLTIILPNTAQPLELPSFFRWIVPFHFAVMSTPRSEEDISILSSPTLGIRRIVTLTEETPLDEKWFIGKRITHTHMPIGHHQCPTIEQVDLIIEMFQDENKLPLLVHCAGGDGRTRTIAACYIAAYGFNVPRLEITQPLMSPSAAIGALELIRPRLSRTQQQDEFVGKWVSTVWKRHCILPERMSEPPPCSLEILGEIPRDADLLVLCGLQGSGKSWFCRALRSRDPDAWKRVSQDESGSRALSETDISHSQGRRVILDRCNPSAADRRHWLSLAHWATKPICVWLDYPTDLCISRAQRRLDHPTLIPGPRVRNAVASTMKEFQRPTLQEGYQGIAVVRSFEACMELVALLSPPLTLFKFPRTVHLLNLGAATEDDLVQPTSAAFLASSFTPESQIVITEKIDGANLGISLDSSGRILIQNRAHWVNSKTHFQFKKLDIWVEKHREALTGILGADASFPERYVLFGEWMVCVHSIKYTRLPDRFLAFDFYDRSRKTFASRDVLEANLDGTGIAIVPALMRIHGRPEEGAGPVMASDEELKGMVQQPSRFYDGRVEGVYVKVEKGGIVVGRGKVVRADFIAGNEHWTRGDLELNGFDNDQS